MLEIFQWIAVGAVIGLIATRLDVINKDQGGIYRALLFSTVGAITGGAVVGATNNFQSYADATTSSLILSVIGAVITLSMYKGIKLH